MFRSAPTISLPPWLGQAGSIAFFAILFANAHKDSEGYAEFRKCHSNCGNGILHALGMPLAVSGVFAIVRSASHDWQFTRLLQASVVTAYLCYYLQYESNQYTPWIFYVVYMLFLEGVLHLMYKLSRLQLLITGVALIVINVGGLEVLGHGFLEHHHSYVKEFFNSVFHTPLYGINSLLLTPEEHNCWW